jgi:hypothetical protein
MPGERQAVRKYRVVALDLGFGSQEDPPCLHRLDRACARCDPSHRVSAGDVQCHSCVQILGCFRTSALPELQGGRDRSPPPSWEQVPPTCRCKGRRFQGGTGVASDSRKSSYSGHDTQKCGAAGTHRNDIDDGSFGVEFCLHPHQCPSGLGSCRDAVVVVYLCNRLLDRSCVLLHVSQSTVGVILAWTALACGTPRGVDSAGDLAAGLFWVGGVSEVLSSLGGQSGHRCAGLSEPNNSCWGGAK